MAGIRHNGLVSLDFGSVPDWVEALGTSGALVYIAFQYHRERGKDRAAREEALEVSRAAELERNDRQAAQARQITVSHGWSYSDMEGCTILVSVNNDSEQVIRHLALQLADVDTGEDVLDVETPTVTPMYLTAQRLKADDMASLSGLPKFQPQKRRDGHDDDGFNELDRKIRVGVSFTDAAGLRWTQYEDGVPRRRIESTLDLRWRVKEMLRPPTPG